LLDIRCADNHLRHRGRRCFILLFTKAHYFLSGHDCGQAEELVRGGRFSSKHLPDQALSDPNRRLITRLRRERVSRMCFDISELGCLDLIPSIAIIQVGKGGPRRVEIGGRERPIEGEPITNGPTDGCNGLLQTAQVSNASAFPCRFTKTFPTGKTSSQNGHLHWHSDGPPFDFGALARDRLEELRALLERDYSEHPPPPLR
jgi:hypothetical protein